MLRIQSRMVDIFGKDIRNFLMSIKAIEPNTTKGFENINLSFLVTAYNELLKGTIRSLNSDQKHCVKALSEFFKTSSKEYNPHVVFTFGAGHRSIDGVQYYMVDKHALLKSFDNPLINKEEELKELISDFDSYVMKRYYSLFRNAKDRLLPFNLTIADVKKLLQRKTCFYSGDKFDITVEELSHSFDRKDPYKGYVKGNVIVCTRQMNALKEELLEYRGLDLKAVMKMVKAMDPTL